MTCGPKVSVCLSGVTPRKWAGGRKTGLAAAFADRAGGRVDKNRDRHCVCETLQVCSGTKSSQPASQRPQYQTTRSGKPMRGFNSSIHPVSARVNPAAPCTREKKKPGCSSHPRAAVRCGRLNHARQRDTRDRDDGASRQAGRAAARYQFPPAPQLNQPDCAPPGPASDDPCRPSPVSIYLIPASFHCPPRGRWPLGPLPPTPHPARQSMQDNRAAYIGSPECGKRWR